MPPAVAEDGLRVVRVGTGLVAITVKLTALEVPPPGVGLKTVMGKVPAEAISAVAMVAVSCVVLTKLVGRSAPFQRTTEPLMKLLPFAVRVKPAPEQARSMARSQLSTGTGLFPPPPVIVKVFAAEIPPARRGCEDRHLRHSGSRHVRRGDGRCQLRRADEAGRPVGSVPAHDRTVDEVAAVRREGEGDPPAVAEDGLRVVRVGKG